MLLERLGRIVAKGGEATVMPAQVPAVEPNIGYQADGVKLQPVSLAGDVRGLFEGQAIVALCRVSSCAGSTARPAR